MLSASRSSARYIIAHHRKSHLQKSRVALAFQRFSDEFYQQKQFSTTHHASVTSSITPVVQTEQNGGDSQGGHAQHTIRKISKKILIDSRYRQCGSNVFGSSNERTIDIRQNYPLLTCNASPYTSSMGGDFCNSFYNGNKKKDEIFATLRSCYDVASPALGKSLSRYYSARAGHYWIHTQQQFWSSLAIIPNNSSLENDRKRRRQRKSRNVRFVQFSSTPSSNADSSSKDDKTTTGTTSSTTKKATTENPNSEGGNPKPNPPSPPATSTKDTPMSTQVMNGIKSLASTIWSIIIKTPGTLWFYFTNPSAFRDKLNEIKEAAKKEAHHYWMGTKLLAADVRTARKMLSKTLQGSSLTRRERKQLLRTTSDLFRLVPFSMFMIIPFMEFALPFALRIFPNMLPSTYQDSLKTEENMKRELQSRIAMAGFFQEALQNLAKEQKKQAEKALKAKKAEEDGIPQTEVEKENTAASFLEFLEKARSGEFLPPDVIISYSKYFQDEMTLDNLPRTQLVNLCKYMSIPAYGSEALLRFQLRHRIRSLREDDQRILWEGIDSLTKMELREACQERGMRSVGMSKRAYKVALQQWLDLSVNKHVPIALLIMSRSFFLHEVPTGPASIDKRDDQEKSVAGIADAISAMDKDVLNEILLEVATSEEKRLNPDIVRISLEVLDKENEKIKLEQEERDKALAKKKAEEEEAALKKKAEEEEAALKKKAEEEVVTKDTTDVEPTVVMAETSTPAREEPVKVEAVPLGDEHVEPPVIIDDVKPAPTTQEDELPVKAEVRPVDITQEQKPSEEEKKKEEEESKLSAEELDAISHLTSPNPVSSEREELERIKEAMKEKKSEREKETADESESVGLSSAATVDAEIVDVDEKVQPADDLTSETSEEEDARAAKVIEKADATVTEEAQKTTVIDLDGKTPEETQPPKEKRETEESQSGDEKLDATMARLKSKLESMVGKIEIQLSDVEEKIGNRLHFLDKDMDGVLSREEFAQCLQLVLRRELTFEEAMAIAADMDENDDGVFTIAELTRWIETNKIVKLAEEGRDVEVDRAIAKAKQQQSESDKPIMAEAKNASAEKPS